MWPRGFNKVYGRTLPSPCSAFLDHSSERAQFGQSPVGPGDAAALQQHGQPAIIVSNEE